jgi:hypothetical protein
MNAVMHTQIKLRALTSASRCNGYVIAEFSAVLHHSAPEVLHSAHTA